MVIKVTSHKYNGSHWTQQEMTEPLIYVVDSSTAPRRGAVKSSIALPAVAMSQVTHASTEHKKRPKDPESRAEKKVTKKRKTEKTPKIAYEPCKFLLIRNMDNNISSSFPLESDHGGIYVQHISENKLSKSHQCYDYASEWNVVQTIAQLSREIQSILD